MEDFSGYVLHQYYLQRKLGEGHFGAVYEAMDMFTGVSYAIKLMKVNKQSKQSYLHEVASHIILSKYPDCNKYVLCLYNYGEYNIREPRAREFVEAALEMGFGARRRVPANRLYMVSELMDGDLEALIQHITEEDIAVDPRTHAFIALQLLRGLRYIHDRDMAHRDIKLGNVLYKLAFPLDKTVTLKDCLEDFDCALIHLEIKYGDLGFTCTDQGHRERLSQFSGKDVLLCTTRGSPLYFSPELMRAEMNDDPTIFLAVGETADLWALAVTLWQLFYLERPPYLAHVDEDFQLLKRALMLLTQPSMDRMLRSHRLTTKIRDPAIAKALTTVFRGLFGIRAMTRMKAATGAEIVAAVL